MLYNFVMEEIHKTYYALSIYILVLIMFSKCTEVTSHLTTNGTEHASWHYIK